MSMSSSKAGHSGSSSSLHRVASLSLPSLSHRSKSFQSKLNFGDTSDDIHVGVQCMRAIMNNQVPLCLCLCVFSTVQSVSVIMGPSFLEGGPVMC